MSVKLETFFINIYLLNVRVIVFLPAQFRNKIYEI